MGAQSRETLRSGDNRDETFAKTAMDWQERFIILSKTMKP